MKPKYIVDVALARRAHAAIAPYNLRSPLKLSTKLSECVGRPVYLKLESHQPTGAFKVRGALAYLLSLEGEARRKGVVAASAGNHALGLAWAARQVGVPALVVVPRSAAKIKKRKLAELMVKVRVHGEGYDEAEVFARKLAEEADASFVSPYDDPWVMAGNGGTIALELLEELGELGGVVLPVGGGGLASGLVTAMGDIPVLGVNAAASPAMALSLAEGRVYETYEGESTLAEGLEGGVSQTSVAYCQQLWQVQQVDEAAIGRAIGFLAREESLVAEGSAAVAVAALLEGHELPGEGPLCVVITGRNIDAERLKVILQA
ncbi:MAG: pyridoxal-phosphate dependent enzyme [Deltaproteobacteria bacterium]|nr:pyridoxal-phosphate dependent enzyme [Deltaproteobacteria bacterium]